LSQDRTSVSPKRSTHSVRIFERGKPLPDKSGAKLSGQWMLSSSPALRRSLKDSHLG
jgi:hypothetical protein